MSEQPIGFASFVRLVIEALEAASVLYLIGGAVAAWAWSLTSRSRRPAGFLASLRNGGC